MVILASMNLSVLGMLSVHCVGKVSKIIQLHSKV
jgi:hypothetical protein